MTTHLQQSSSYSPTGRVGPDRYERGDAPHSGPQRALNTLDALDGKAFLMTIGMRVRRQRLAAGLSRRALAARSGVSERYLAQLESGQGNMSIMLLRKVSAAIEQPLNHLLDECIADVRQELL